MVGLVHISMGGPDFTIQVRQKRYTFEFHPYCGPIVLKRNGGAAASQPNFVMEACSLWAAQGKKVENGLCVWFHEPKPILKHLGGRHWQIVGEHPAVRGE